MFLSFVTIKCFLMCIYLLYIYLLYLFLMYFLSLVLFSFVCLSLVFRVPVLNFSTFVENSPRYSCVLYKLFQVIYQALSYFRQFHLLIYFHHIFARFLYPKFQVLFLHQLLLLLFLN